MTTDNETANGNKEMSIGGSGFSLHSPGYNCKGGIVLNIHSFDESTGAGGMFGSRPVEWLLQGLSYEIV
jgi:hypothetical protein